MIPERGAETIHGAISDPSVISQFATENYPCSSMIMHDLIFKNGDTVCI